MVKGDIYLGRFPYGGSPGPKNRPLLLLTGPVGSVPEFLTAFLSSTIPSQLLPTDLVLDPGQPEFASTNLKAISVVRLHKLSTVHQRDLYRQLGSLSPAALGQVEQRLRFHLNI